MTDKVRFAVFRMYRGPAFLLVLMLAAGLSMIVPTARAEAACNVPNQIANGQVADATAVMDNFNTVANCADSAVTPSGAPIAGNLTVFSSQKSITNGDLSGDCSTTGALAVKCTKTNGAPFGYFATGTNADQLTGTISVNRFNNGQYADDAHFLRGDGTWAVPPGTGGSAGGTPVVRASTIQSSSGSSYTVTWPSGTIAGDVVLIFGEHAYSFNNPTGWAVLDNQAGGNANGFVIAKIMTSADIAASSVTITTNGAYNGSLAAVTINGGTMTGMRAPAAFVRSTGGPSSGGSVGLYSFTPMATDLVLGFVGVRAASNLGFSTGFTALSSINATEASATVGKFTGSLGLLGLDEKATSNVAANGYYTAVVVLR